MVCIDKNDDNFVFCDDYFQYLIDNHITWDREDISEFIDGWEVETQKAEDLDRWTRGMTTICQLGDKYFAVDWEEGLTEYQENWFDNQPYEVELHEYQKVITVHEWITKET